MADPRSTPQRQTMQKSAAIVAPLSDLYRQPDGPRDRQLLFGAGVTVLDETNGWSYLQSDEGYCGYVRTKTLGPAHAPTHSVCAYATHVYEEPNMKSPDMMGLSHGSLLKVEELSDGFAKTHQGYIPAQHIRALDTPETDPVAVAERFLGAPYLWGGNSAWGIDCSGLVQAACRACAIPCPGDSDQQERALGTHLPADTSPKRGDLLFWKGHVAMLWDAKTLIHANAHAMATAFEPLESAIARIAKSDGPITAHKRLS